MNQTSIVTTTTTTTTGPAGVTTTTVTTVQTVVKPKESVFVNVSGRNFILDGAIYPVIGSNAWWISITECSKGDLDQCFYDIARTGATTVRTWGSKDTASADGIYYQLWTNGKATVNAGPNGLQHFDDVVAAAKANGIRLIVPLVDNWGEGCGMDLYVSQLSGKQDHGLFFTDENVKLAYKTYVQTFVSRYKDEPTIMAWEVANMPRRLGSSGLASSSCTDATVLQWVMEMSAFVKSIDSNHLVGIGDEGFFDDLEDPGKRGGGANFLTNLNIKTIDYGTFQLMPEYWGHSDDAQEWGSQWIKDHDELSKTSDKPVILESFGVTACEKEVYTAWLDTVVSSGLAGDLMWHSGSHPSVGGVPRGSGTFAVYLNNGVYPLLVSHAMAMKSRKQG